MPSTILLCSANSVSSTDLYDLLKEANCNLRTHAISGALPDDARSEISAFVMDVQGDGTTAATLTRRWRAELAEDLMPILWVIPETDAGLAALGLNSGADVVLARPVDPRVFLAQVGAAIRTRHAAVRVAERTREYRLLAEQLSRTRQQLDQEYAAARRIQFALQHRPLPQEGAVQVHIGHRAGGRAGTDFYSVEQVSPDTIAFIIGNVGTYGTRASLLAISLCTSALRHTTSDPGQWLGEINSELLRITSEDPPLVAACAGVIDVHTGELRIARAGMLAPIFVPTNGEVVAIEIPGTFLGTSETYYQTYATRLLPSDKVLIGTEGLCLNGRSQLDSVPKLLAIATELRHQSGQKLVDSAMTRTLSNALQDVDVTILALGFTHP